MIMIATIREVWANRLLVRDHATGQEVMVNTDCTKCLSAIYWKVVIYDCCSFLVKIVSVNHIGT